MVVERDEVERRADPDDRRDDVQPAEQQVEPVVRVRVDQRSLPSVARDRDQLDEGRVELLVAGALEPLAEDRHDLGTSGVGRRRRRSGSRTSPRTTWFSYASSAMTAGSSAPLLGAEGSPIAGCAPSAAAFSRRRSTAPPRRPARADPRSRRAARRAACGPRTAPRAPASSAAAVARAPVRRDEERDVVVAFLRARARARRGGRTARADGTRAGRRRRRAPAASSGMRPSASVSPRADRLAAAEELDADAARGRALARVEDVGRQRDAHGRNLRA